MKNTTTPEVLTLDPSQVRRVASIIAHHVRSPLAGISGALSILRDRSVHQAEDHAIMAEILSRIVRLNDSIEEIVTFGRPIFPNLSTVSSLKIIRDASKAIGNNGFGDVDIQVPSEDIPILSDPRLLKQSLYGMLINAAEAMHGQGTITISLSRRDHGDNSVCTIEITDNGPGCSHDSREQLFEPFFTTKSQHIGLGLSMCRRLLRAQGGDVICTPPKSNQGTTLIVTIPVPD